MVQTLSMTQPMAARVSLSPGRASAFLLAFLIAVAGLALAPGTIRANQNYLEAGGTGVAQPTRFLTRKQVEAVARTDIGKLHGLRIGPFAPRAASVPAPLAQAEGLIGHPVAAGANVATPAWVVTVEAAPKTDVLGQPTTATVFTDVIDAVSGAVLDRCPGCRSVRMVR
jgi:hypothetical protein